MENLNKAMIIRNGNVIGTPSTDFEELTFEQYKEMEANGEIDLNKKYLVKADDSGALLSAEDVSYDEDTSVKGKISDLDDKITKHSLPLLYDSGVRGNSSVEIYKISNVLKTASGGSDPNNLNLLLSTRGGDEVEIAGGKNDSSWFVQAKRNLSSITPKISSLYRDGLDLYIRLELYFNFLRIYHKSGVLPDDFKVERVSSIPDTATEIAIKGETVADKEPTDITFNGDSTYFDLGGGNHKYEIKNGVCYFQVYVQTKGNTTTTMKAIANLPKPKYEKNFNVAPYVWSNDKYTPLRASITTGGVLQACMGGIWYSYFIEGSYPVKA